MKKRLKISKKIYVSPLVEFEEIEQDELDMLMAGSDHSGTIDYDEEGGGSQTPGGSGNPGGRPKPTSLDMDFSMDFVINDEPQY